MFPLLGELPPRLLFHLTPLILPVHSGGCSWPLKNNSPFLVTTLGDALESTFFSLSCSWKVCSCDQFLSNEMVVEYFVGYSQFLK